MEPMLFCIYLLIYYYCCPIILIVLIIEPIKIMKYIYRCSSVFPCNTVNSIMVSYIRTAYTRLVCLSGLIADHLCCILPLTLCSTYVFTIQNTIACNMLTLSCC